MITITRESHECKIRGAVFKCGPDITRELILAERAQTAARIGKQLAGNPDGLVFGRGVDCRAVGTQPELVAQDALRGNLHVQIGRCQDEIVQFELLPRIDTRGARHHGEFAYCIHSDVGSPAVRDQGIFSTSGNLAIAVRTRRR